MSSARAIRRLFVANRGEIAVRIIDACRKLGIEAVVGVSEADRETLAAKRADRTVCIGPASATESYLRGETIVVAAKGTGCDAIHPGYGFLAERADFRRLCDEHGVIFVGPSAEAIDAMGDKLEARAIARELAIPTVPGSDQVSSAEEALQVAQMAGYPSLLKASAGGGGRGMRIVRCAGDVPAAFESARAEALAAFGDPTIYIERYVERARHVEIQVLGDAHGRMVHFGERDCSTQRRHQKLIEEAPSPIVDPELRAKMTEAALRLASHVKYVGAGTVEFIVDLDTRAFYFLEMNTRIQVEHPVTEAVTGFDLVAEMIRVAGGSPLCVSQSQIAIRGHAIECRINAEAPERDFMPAPGRLVRWKPPAGDGIRVDTHCYEGYMVPPFYDSMIAKLVVQGADRSAAVARMQQALAEFEVEGLATTIPFHRDVLSHPDFRDNRVTTSWVEHVFAKSGLKGTGAK